jgi:hypothetical protein
VTRLRCPYAFPSVYPLRAIAVLGDAVVDGGTPLAGDDQTITGYSILQADSRDALDQILHGHPHTEIGTIEVLECLPMPGR